MHRSAIALRPSLGRGRGRLAAVGALLALALTLPVPAAAQGPFELPADAQAIGAPTPDGRQLFAWLHAGLLCTVLHDGRFQDPLVGMQDECPEIPILTPLGHETFGSDASPPVAYGVVGTDVAAVQLAARDHVVASAPVVAGHGPLAGIRFFVVAAAGARPVPTELHLLDASGAVRRASEIDALSTSFDPLRVRGSARTIARGGHGRGAWRLNAYRERHLRPTPLEPLRRADVACVKLVRGRWSGGSPHCPDDLDLAGNGLLNATSETDCGADGTTVLLLARPAVRRVVAVLGDGRRVTARLTPIVPGANGMSAGVVAVDEQLAIRRLDAVGVDGRHLLSMPLGLAPAAARCGDPRAAVSTDDIWASPTEMPHVAAGAAVVAADRGADLCLGLAGWPSDRRWCELPPVEVDDVQVHTAPAGAVRAELSLVPTDVATAELVLEDGSTVPVVARPLPAGYTGRYAAVTRVLRVDVPGGRRVAGITMRDAAGRLLGNVPTFDFGLPAPQTMTPILRRSGLPTLFAGIYDLMEWPVLWHPVNIPCLAFGRPPAADCVPSDPRELVVDAQCTPRRIAIYGFTAAPAERLSLETAAGTTIAGTTATLPTRFTRGLTLPARVVHAGAALLVAPAGARPVRLVLRGRRTWSGALPLPAAADQCGYAMTVDLTGGR